MPQLLIRSPFPSQSFFLPVPSCSHSAPSLPPSNLVCQLTGTSRHPLTADVQIWLPATCSGSDATSNGFLLFATAVNGSTLLEQVFQHHKAHFRLASCSLCWLVFTSSHNVPSLGTPTLVNLTLARDVDRVHELAPFVDDLPVLQGASAHSFQGCDMVHSNGGVSKKRVFREF